MADGYIELYEHDAYKGRRAIIPFRTDVNSLPDSDNEDYKFLQDRTSSIRYFVPDGWECQLCEHKDFNGWALPLRGRGEIASFAPNDQVTSIRWQQLPDVT